MINEAIYTLYEGVGNVEAIDTAMKLGAHHPMGPLELADFIGLDTCLSVMQVLHEGLADSKYRPCPLLVKYVEAGWLGRKAQPRLLRLSRRKAGADAVGQLQRPSVDCRQSDRDRRHADEVARARVVRRAPGCRAGSRSPGSGTSPAARWSRRRARGCGSRSDRRARSRARRARERGDRGRARRRRASTAGRAGCATGASSSSTRRVVRPRRAAPARRGSAAP